MRQEVRRGRKFVEYIDDSLPVGTFVQEIGAHDVSYQDENGAWLATDENWAVDRLDGYLFKNDKLNHKVKLKGDGGRRWYPRRNIESEYLTFGIPQFWDGKRWKNFGFNGYSVEGKTITLNTRQNVTILVHSLWSGIKIDWVLANASAPKRMRYPVTLTGITESEGVLYGADNTELGKLTPTTATDANDIELPCSGSYVNGYLQFEADVTGAVFPVTIDPDFAGNSGDGYVIGSGTSVSGANSSENGNYFNSTNNTIKVGRESNGDMFLYSSCRGLLKIDTSTIPDTDTVDQVNLRLVATNDYSNSDFDLQIVKYNWSGQDPLAAGNCKDAFDGCVAATADDSIWKNTSGMSVNTQYTSGNLSTAWVSKTGYTYYGLISKRDKDGTNFGWDNVEYVLIASASHATTSYRPLLIVTHSAAATGALRRTNMNAQMQSLTGGFN